MKGDRTSSPRPRLVRVPSRLLLWGMLLGFVLAGQPVATLAQDEDADSLPGLLARYQVGERSIERIDADVAVDLNRESPDPRLPSGRWSGLWTGQILIREDVAFQFHAFIEGQVSVKVGGRTVLAGQSQSAAWISGQPET